MDKLLMIWQELNAETQVGVVYFAIGAVLAAVVAVVRRFVPGFQLGPGVRTTALTMALGALTGIATWGGWQGALVGAFCALMGTGAYEGVKQSAQAWRRQ
ncbi:MAG: hypothetical protein AB7Y46_08735 [Armatimonadota bacterium]